VHDQATLPGPAITHVLGQRVLLLRLKEYLNLSILGDFGNLLTYSKKYSEDSESQTRTRSIGHESSPDPAAILVRSYQDMSCWLRFAMGFDTGGLINVLECKVLGHDQ
jgi:hypothetical protein